MKLKLENNLEKKFNSVKKALNEYVLDKTGKQLTSLEVLRVIERPFSDSLILQAKYNGQVHKMVMKSPTHHPVNKTVMEAENQAEVEFNIMSRIYPMFRDLERCGVPQPILVLPDIETYVMGFVEGRLLVDTLPAANYFASKSSFERLREDYFNCGRWLKHFQDGTGVRKAGPEVLEGIISRCEQRLTYITEANNKQCPKNLKSDVMGFMREQQSLIEDNSILIAGRHGDFGAWNIISDLKGITVIDYLGYTEEPVLVDLLKMLINFDNEEKALRSSKARIRVLRDSFLEGYGDIYQISVPVMKICETLHRTANLSIVVNRKYFRFYQELERRQRFRANLDWLMNDRGEKSTILKGSL